jgi:hypothetical protein
MIKNWQIFNENQESEEFRYESELLEVISDLMDDDLAELVYSESLYYKELGPDLLSREPYKLYGSVPCHMFRLEIKVETKFIQSNSTWCKDVDIFQKIYPILGSIKSWAKGEDLKFLFQVQDNNLNLLFIQND